MVVFTCDACGESLRKTAVEKHYKFKCKSSAVLTCIDCQKDFPGDTYIEHTRCITEDEKYGGKNYQAKANANKGLKKQNAWIENLQDLIASRAGSLDSDVRSVTEAIMAYENVPRKKPKFMNFAKNVLGGGRRSSPQTLEKTWELLELALKKPAEAPTPQKASQSPVKGEPKSPEKEPVAQDDSQESEAKTPKKRKAEDDCTISGEDTSSKKSKKDKKKDKKKSVESAEVSSESNGVTEESSENLSKSAKKEKKKNKKKDKVESAEAINGESNGVTEAISEELTKSAKKEKKKDKKKSSESVVNGNSGEGSDTPKDTSSEEVSKKDEDVSKEPETCRGVPAFKGTGRKRKSEAPVADSEASSPKKPSEASDQTSPKKDKVKKNNSVEVNGDVKSEGNVDEPKSSKKKDKKKEKKTEDVAAAVPSDEASAAKSGKFDWESAAVDVLKNKGSSMKTARLKKKVMKAYWDSAGKGQQLGAEEKSKLESKMLKKLKKSDKIEFGEESSKLVGVEDPASSNEDEVLVTGADKEEDKGLKDEVAQMLSALKSEVKSENKENGIGSSGSGTSFQGETSTPQSFNQWESANLGDDGANEKFRRLMGLGKSSKPSGGLFGSLKKSPAPSKHGSSVADRDQVSKMFSQQEQQFKQAVGAKRGAGFGFGAKEEPKPQNKKITFDD